MRFCLKSRTRASLTVSRQALSVTQTSRLAPAAWSDDVLVPGMFMGYAASPRLRGGRRCRSWP